MLLYPSVDELKTKVDSKYTLAIMAAKRARDLIDGKPMLTLDTENEKPLSIATQEISEDLISYKRVEEVQAADAAEEPAAEEAEAPEEEEALPEE
ncbi:MAG: DNA-directed RNA polymerase subunit omega [Firmicutes bacterium]|nr:DNA-directed RNA polymerase subunit omega [Bacillota bacterium]MBQ1887258.1 DNA-directed RNA polymerase subunit omega [Bacillota bacterium]MBQ2456123.1 DNA-directed RNA polymerase subunit omega [Bacillota bacterium]MBQ3577845.1 DNA-directed RNA polymerase subunit omega [Bacillota bacterium]MBQ4181080.1 DNA-directed RNA polymerase subunit omega [Bacillota bacterium]